MIDHTTRPLLLCRYPVINLFVEHVCFECVDCGSKDCAQQCKNQTESNSNCSERPSIHFVQLGHLSAIVGVNVIL